MSRKNDGSVRRSWKARLMAVTLAVTMLLTSSGFQVLAQEVGTESQADAAAIAAQQAAEEEAARQAAEAAAAQQAAEEEAARQAAEAAAAQQAAEEEAARQAAEAAAAQAAEEAAAAQQAAEEEAARQAAEAAAAQQAAADAEAARQQQQETQAKDAATEGDTSSEEKEPVVAGKLVLKTDAASTQNAGEPAKLRVEYGLGTECTLASVETRLYIWNKNVQFPQFANGTYTDPSSGRTFVLKTDSDGDTYIEYILKPGQSFSQEFQFTDSTVAPGESVTFDVAICAMGEIPTDNSIQTAPGKITYAVPAEETQSSEGENEEAPADGEDIVLNTVAFEVAEGATVTVDGADATNATAMAKNGTIVFHVAAAEGYEVTEILVDRTIPARTTGNSGEYIIENIQTNETVVVVATQINETEAEEVETEVEAAEEATETETEVTTEVTETEATTEEAETETEEEVEYGTNFAYSNGEVTVTATAAPEAKIPANAELRADAVPAGSAAFENAVDLAESQLGTPEGYESEYVFYDVYFLVDGQKVEPEDGTVSVTIDFATPVFADSEEVAEDYSVVHITEDAQVEVVTDSVSVNESGAVEAVGFTTDSFSLIGAKVMRAAANVPAPQAAGDYRMTGTYDSSTNSITWKVYLNENGHTFDGSWCTLGASYPDGTTVIHDNDKPPAMLYMGNVSQDFWAAVSATGFSGDLNPTAIPTTDDVWFEYKTAMSQEDWDAGNAVTHTASISINGSEPVNVSATVSKNGADIERTSDQLEDFIYAATIVPDDGRGADGNPTADNGSSRVTISFKEDSSPNGLQYAKTLYYNLPQGITVYETETGVIEGVGALAGAQLGTYTINPPATQGGQATMTVVFNDEINGQPFSAYKNLDCTIEFNSWFNLDSNEENQRHEFKFNDVTVDIYFTQGNKFSGKKSASTYIKGEGNQPGYFEFTIEFQSDDPIPANSNLIIEDTLGANLELVDNSITLSGINQGNVKTDPNSDKSGFTITINEAIEPHTPVTVTYRAVIKDVTDLDSNGVVKNTGNTAIVGKNTDDKIKLNANPTYTPGAVASKGNDGVSSEDGKVKWTITVNPNGDRNMSGVEIEDILQDEELIYDTSTPITSDPALPEFTWDKILNSSENGWKYKFPDNAGYQTYVITYKTIVPSSSESKTYSNNVYIDSEKVDSSYVNVGTGTGTGTGVEKKFDREETVNGIKYVHWQSTVTIPAAGAKNVVYTDKLAGSHTLEDPLNVTVTDQDGNAVTPQITRNDDQNFTVNFGDVEPADNIRVYTISYRTVAENGTVKNTGFLQADGKTTSAPTSHTVQDFSFTKSGDVTDKANGIITWKVVLNNGYFDLGTKNIVVEDSFTGNLAYVPNSAKLTMNGSTFWQESDAEKYVTVDGNTITVKVGKIPGPAKYVLEYQTKLTSSVGVNEVNTFKNTATVKGDGAVLGEPSTSVTFSNKVLSKSLLDKAVAENHYVARYQILLNEERQFFDENVDSFSINDKMSENQTLDRDSIKLERQRTINGDWEIVPKSEYEEGMTVSDHVINLTVKTSAANINRVVYRLSYNATVSKGDSKENSVPYDNDVTYTIAGQPYAGSTGENADFGQSSGGSGTGEVVWFKIVKNKLGTVEVLPGAVFDLYSVDANGNETLVKAGLTTGADGSFTFGADTTKVEAANRCSLNTDTKYRLRERTAPAGYCKADDVDFYVSGGTTVPNGWAVGFTKYIEDAKAVTVRATKEWEVPTGTVIPEVTFKLYSRYEGETEYKEVEGAAAKTINGTTKVAEWTELPYEEMVDGQKKKIEYTVQETFKDSAEASKYSQEIGIAEWDEKTSTYSIEVKNATTNHAVRKVWEDNNNANGNRPTSITVQLKQNGKAYGSAVNVTPDASGNWSYTWSGLPKYDSNGKGYKYTATETALGRYDTEYDDSDSSVTVITNKLKTEETSHTIKKVWDDGDNADGVRPTEITVQLYNGTTKYGSQVTIKPDTNGSWSYTWDKLPLYINGEAANYHAEEVNVSNDYTSTRNTSGTTTTITNKHDYDKVNKSVRKKWVGDNEVADNNRQPITVQLHAKVDNADIAPVREVVLKTDNNWEHTWTDLPKNYHGFEIIYYVTEKTDLSEYGYVSSTDVNKDGVADVDIDGAMLITNTYTRQLTKRTVEKVWDDDKNRDGKRPATIEITLTGMAGDTQVYADTQILSGTAEVDDEMKLSYTWDNLQMYQDGVEIVYTIAETMDSNASSYYKDSTEIADITEAGKVIGKKIILTNTHYSEKISIPATKEWDDNDNQDGLRVPVQLQLYQVINKVTTPISEIKEANAENNWTVTWDNLNKYAGGKEIGYYVREVNVPDGYENINSDENSLTVKNKHIPATTDVSVTKVWDDNNDQDGLRPDSITVNLFAGISVKDENTDVTKNIDITESIDALKGAGNTKSIVPVDSTDAEAAWTVAKWENLPEYYQGSKITYSVTEDAVDGYTTGILNAKKTDDEGNTTDDPYSFVVTNTHKTAETSITATKVWDDDSNRDGKRPTEITFQLYKQVPGGTLEAVAEDGKQKSGTQVLKAEGDPNSDSWQVTWTELPEKEDGKTLTYSVKEVKVGEDGTVVELTDEELLPYKRTTSSDGRTITNQYKPATTNVDVTKIWDDSNNMDNKRPGSITVTLNAAVSVDGNETSIPVTFYDADSNTYKVSEASSIEVMKDAALPEQKSAVVILKPNAGGEWPTYTWTDLPAKHTVDGKSYDITYSVTELPVENYTTVVTKAADSNDFTVTNTYETENTAFAVQKLWSDNENQDGIRPSSLNVQLLADGETFYYIYKKNETDGVWDGTWTKTKVDIPVLTLTPNADEAKNWYGTWENLPVKKDGGQDIVYTLKEVGEIEGYTEESNEFTTVNVIGTFVIENKHETELISKQLIKYWVDQNTEGEIDRPAKATFELTKSVYEEQPDGTYGYSDPIVVEEKTVNVPAREDGMIVTCSWANLDKMWNGQPIIYEVVEKEVPEGYQIYSENKSDYTAIYNVTTKAEISKTDLTGSNEISGAELQILDENGVAVDSWTSDGNKHIVTGLSIGAQYTLHEVSAPTGYLKADDIVFTISKDGSVQKVTMQDAPTRVIISKTDLAGEDLKGAKFQILDGENKAVEAWTSDGGEHLIEAKLSVGTTYTLVETEAPNGYTIADPVRFTINEKGEVIVDNQVAADNKITVKDAPRKISFAKIDAKDNYVSGAALEVHYATADGKVGSLATTVDGIAMTWISGNTAKEFSGVKKGIYYLVETQAPAGYLNTAEPKAFEVTGEVGADDVQTVELENILTEIRIDKQFWRGDEKVGALDEPAIFEILDQTGAAVETNDGTKLDYISMDGSDVITIKGLPAGNYILREVYAPAGYAKAKDIPFAVSASENMSEPIEVKNYPIEVEISKRDFTSETEEELPGATFVVIRKALPLSSDDTEIEDIAARNVYGEPLTFTSGSDPFVLTGVMPGEYYLVEVKAPEGFVKLANPIEFTIDEGLTVEERHIVLDPIYNSPTEVTVSKKDLQTNKPLSGAHLEVRAVVEAPDGSISYEELAESVYESVSTSWTTDGSDYIIRGLPVGSYALVETVVPDGYAAADTILFDINEDGTSTVYYEDNIADSVYEVEMLDDTTKVEISKVAITDGPELPGATLQVIKQTKDAEGNVTDEEIIEEWVSTDEVHKIEGKLVAGEEYVLREITAPDGYNVANDISFTVSEDGSVDTVEMVDESTKVSFSKKAITDGPELPGATLQVLKTVTLEDGTTTTVVVEEWKSTDEEHLIEAKLKVGETYILREITAPDGYTRAVDVTFTVEPGGKVQQVEMIDKITSVVISKQDVANSAELPGATLQILDKETGKIATTIRFVDDETTPDERLEWVSGDTPRTITGLRAGEYILREITAPAGFTIANDIEFTVTDDLKLVGKTYTMNDEATELTVAKLDKETGKPVTDAELEIRDADGKVAVNAYGEELKVTTTDEAAVLYGIKPGKYTLVETKAPTGYTVAAPVEFEVDEDLKVSEKELSVSMTDAPTEVNISKTDIVTGKELPGATLQVLKTVKDKDGKEVLEVVTTIYDEKLEWISGKEPKNIKGLPAGDYILREITAPDGYTVAKDVPFTVTDELKPAELVPMENEPIRLEISKTGFTKDGKVVALEGAKLEIRERNTDDTMGDVITNVYGEKMRFESATEAVVLNGVKPGNYWLVETDAPDGYTVADPIKITINEDMTVSQNPVTLIVEDCPTEVSISKTDITTGKELPGAELQVLDKKTGEVVTTIYGEKLEWISGETPKTITGLPAGDYILREITAPAGYAVAEDKAFTITEDLHVENKVVMEDQPTEVSISKRKMLGVSELPGASLQVLDENGTVATTIYGEKLEWVSGETEKVIKGLKPGKYTLKEVKSPDGYAVAESIVFEVKEGKFEAQEIIMRDDTTKVHISKMDVTNNKELAGARLALKDAQGEVIAEWTSTGKPKVINGQLIAGATYTLTEISAPVGYDLAKDITFTVNSDGKIQTVVMEDKVSDGKGKVTVQKLVMMNGKYMAVDYTFYVALFADEACTQRVTNVKPLDVEGSYTASTIFSNLQYGKYYVAETDEEGNAISEGLVIESNQIVDGEITLTPNHATAKSTIINHVKDLPGGYYMDGEITVDKRVLINGREGNVDDTFYFALFTDAELTMMADAGVKALKLNNASSGKVTFSELPYGEYYLAETDENGIPVGDDFAYNVTISSYCSVDENNKSIVRTVINSKQEDEDEETTTTTSVTKSGGKTTAGTKPVKTGDDTPFGMYLVMLAVSAAALLGILFGFFRRRRRSTR